MRYKMFMHGRLGMLAPLVLLLSFWAGGAWLNHRAYMDDLALAKAEYVSESRRITDRTSQDVAHVFQAIYEQLRTIGRLPGLKGFSHDQEFVDFRGGGEAFDADAREAIQEIYNNLASSVDMSEVYIVPADFDPEAIDPQTGELQEPSITFDELIVGRTASSGHHGEPAGDEHDEIEEIEIYEYRVMKRQIALLRARFPRIESIEGLAYPAAGGPEVVTCDNRYYSPAAPDDAARSGLVYSVPYYDNAGDFAGIVSGVILTYSLREKLGMGQCLILNPKHDYKVVPETDGAWVDREASWHAGKADPSLLYSETAELPILDIDGPWLIWAGREDAEFWNQASVKAHRHLAVMRQLGLAFVLGAMLVVWLLICRSQRALITRNAELEQRVQKQTADLLQVSRQAGMAEIATGVLHNVGNVLNSVNLSAGMIASTVEGSRLTSLSMLVGLLDQEKHQLGTFVTDDPRGKCLPEFLEKLHGKLADEQGKVQQEIQQLVSGIDHIKEIVRLQQVSATMASNVLTAVDPVALMEQAVTVNLIAMKRHAIKLHRDYEPDLPKVSLEEHKTLQILINLINNAKKATCHGSIDERRVTLRIRYELNKGMIVFEVCDNGVGIDAESLPQLFRHGFSKFENGHGFGLHIGACAASEMHGNLSAESGGPGSGATFRLSLPTSQAAAEALPARVST